MSNDAFKAAAAERALEYVENGMRLGLGTGSTAAKFVDLLGKKVTAGLDVVCVADLAGNAGAGRGAWASACPRSTRCRFST